jgi:asparagine synthase (glutamine-hydrolysing)
MGMAHSLELRVPFMDHSIVELAARIPGELQVRRGVEKYILRQAFAPLLPPEITWRKKYPLQMRVNRDLIGTLDGMCDLLLRPDDVRARGFFEPSKVQALRKKRPSAGAPVPAHKFWTWRIWSMLLCEIWARMFLDRPIGTTPPHSLADLT